MPENCILSHIFKKLNKLSFINGVPIGKLGGGAVIREIKGKLYHQENTALEKGLKLWH